MQFRRDRLLTCQVIENKDASIFCSDQPIDFSCPSVLEQFPNREFFFDPQARAVTADVLMQDDIFDPSEKAEIRVKPSLILNHLFQRVENLLSEELSPRSQLVRIIDCFMMIASYVYAEGPLTPFLRSETVTEVMMSGFEEMWVERNGHLERSLSPFSSWEDLWAWLSRAASLAGRELVTARGCADFSLSCGTRVHVVLPPLSRSSGYVSLRCHRESSLSLADLVELNALTPEQKDILEELVRSKKNILLAGATSTGKTTVLRALANCIDAHERIVILEDVSEIRLAHAHSVYLQTVESNADESRTKVTLEDLVREALRMRPDRLVVGECRGNEAFALIQALHTGHRGSFSTLHANSAHDALRRLESLVLRAEPSMSSEMVRQLILNAFDVIVFLERSPDRKRRVSCIQFVQDIA